MDFSIQDLKSIHSGRRKEIRERLSEFKKNWNQGDRKLFGELCFCTLTPQSKARDCDKAVKRLLEKGILFEGGLKELEKKVHPIRFYKNKSKWILHNRELFSDNGKLFVKEKLKEINQNPKPFLLREWLVRNVKGFGYKEASHFLRNIGLGKDMAILDRHILKNLKQCRVIKEIPANLTANKYLQIENKMKKFSKKIGIPIQELDMVFWAMETGEVFK